MEDRKTYLDKIGKRRAILEEEASLAEITTDDIRGPSRKSHIVAARDQVIRRLRDDLQLTLVAIGHVVQRDHSTIVASLRRTQEKDNA